MGDGKTTSDAVWIVCANCIGEPHCHHDTGTRKTIPVSAPASPTRVLRSAHRSTRSVPVASTLRARRHSHRARAREQRQKRVASSADGLMSAPWWLQPPTSDQGWPSRGSRTPARERWSTNPWVPAPLMSQGRADTVLMRATARTQRGSLPRERRTDFLAPSQRVRDTEIGARSIGLEAPHPLPVDLAPFHVKRLSPGRRLPRVP